MTFGERFAGPVFLSMGDGDKAWPLPYVDEAPSS